MVKSIKFLDFLKIIEKSISALRKCQNHGFFEIWSQASVGVSHGFWQLDSCLESFGLVSDSAWNSLLVILGNFFWNTSHSNAYILVFLDSWVKTLRPKYPGFQIRSGLAWDRDFQTQRLYFTICCPILRARDGDFYWILCIFSKLLKSWFPHWENVKILDFLKFGHKPP